VILLCNPGWVIAADRYVTFYGGRYSDDSLGDILVNKPLNFENSIIAVLAFSKTLYAKAPSYQWEVEAQFGKHFREQTHWEFNIAAIFRWKRFPWNQYLRTSLAIGDGLSYATEVPPLELSSHTNEGATRLLNYIVIEMTVAPPQVSHWSIVARIHHRSGIYGIFDDVRGGSNILGAGVKFEF
jgi:hypothetical protein